MTETLLDIVQTAADELMVEDSISTSVIGSTDEFTRGLLAMAQSAGRNLARQYEWGVLQTLATIPTVAGQSDYAMPVDYYRMVNDTSWDTSTNWQVTGPLTPQAEQYLRDSAVGQTTVYRQFRVLGRNKLRITPVPPDASGVIAFLYLSRNWVVRDDGTTTADTFANDDDTTVFDFDLMVKECRWRWRSAKGFDASEAKIERDEVYNACVAADQGGGVLNMSGWCDNDQGCNVVAMPTPNFRLSDGSGSYIVID